jgi:hypothetical protein
MAVGIVAQLARRINRKFCNEFYTGPKWLLARKSLRRAARSV